MRLKGCHESKTTIQPFLVNSVMGDACKPPHLEEEPSWPSRGSIIYVAEIYLIPAGKKPQVIRPHNALYNLCPEQDCTRAWNDGRTLCCFAGPGLGKDPPVSRAQPQLIWAAGYLSEVASPVQLQQLNTPVSWSRGQEVSSAHCQGKLSR